MARSVHDRMKQRRASQAGMLVAAAAVPNTFQKTLMPRKTLDQGAITGITMAVDYLIVATIRKTVEDMADGIAGSKFAKDDDGGAHRRQRQTALLLDLALLGASTYSQKYFKKGADESNTKAVLQTGSTWLKYSAMAGLTVNGLDSLFGASATQGKLSARYKRPWGLIGGALFAGYGEWRRRQAESKYASEQENAVNAAEAVAIGLSVLGALATIDTGEKLVAEYFSKNVAKVLPGSEDFFWSLGHGAALAGTGLGIVATVRKVYRQIEEVATDIEPAYLEPPTSKMVSGSPASPVDWPSLSVQGRRFVSGAVTPAETKSIMGGSAKEPIRVYAGLDSAPTEKDRLNLLLDELKRTDAYSRDCILLVSPTGTGYVNYVAVESAEIMSRGNIATAALQYSKRPSPMSLDRVPEGNLQFRMMAKGVATEIAKLPEKRRPKLYIFGESLGAWTSQDAFIGQGTDGLQFAAIDRALWIGTPFGSKWKDQVLGKERPDVDKDLVGKFDNIKELNSLPPAKKRALRYVMLTHYNDPVAIFSASLLIREPDWLKDPQQRPPTVSRSQFYTSPGTFLLTLIDMGNAMNVVPGKFEASGHDYRADLAEFVRASYDFSVTAAQMKKAEAFLRQNEKARAGRLEAAKKDGK